MPKKVQSTTDGGSEIVSYKDKSWNEQRLNIPTELYNRGKQAVIDYEKSKRYIDDHYIHLWNKGIKSYMLFTGDRQAYIKDWQSNARLGMIRSNIDTYISFLENVPLQFITNGINETAYQVPLGREKVGKSRLEYVKDFVNFVGQFTKFNEQASLWLIEGAQIGVANFQTLYHDYKIEGEKKSIITMINGEFKEIQINNEQTSTPYTIAVDPYEIFPDIYSGKNPRNVSRRFITSQESFIDSYGVFILSEKNELSKIITKEVLAELMINHEHAHWDTFSTIRDEILNYENKKVAEQDTIYKTLRQNNVSAEAANSEEKRKGLVEALYTEYADKIVIHVNGYVVCIMDNPNSKVMFDFVQAYHTRSLLSEGPAYLQFGLEDLQDSFFNNYIDNARVNVHGRYMYDGESFNATPNIADLEPGGILKADRLTENTLRVVPNAPISDAGIMNITDAYGQKLLGVSDIDQGRTARLRVAAEAASLATATNRRMNSYIRRYLDAIGHVGEKWISLHKRMNIWETTTKEDGSTEVLEQKTWWFCKDIDGQVKTFDVTPDDLDGSYLVSLDSQALFAMSGESAVQKKTTVYNAFKDIMLPEQRKRMAQSVFRDMGLNPAYYLPEAEPLPTPAPNPEDNQIPQDILDAGFQPPEVTQGQDIAQTLASEVDMWNQGKWQ